MENSENNVLDFFNKHGAEGAEAVEKSFDSADSQQRVNLNYSGRYRMKVGTFGYVKDNVFKSFPNMYESAKKKALMLTVSLRVVDGTKLVPKGASIFHNITLAPAPGAKQETIQAIARISKPQLVALYGKDDIKATPKWLIENCLPKFEQDGDNWKLVKDHNLQNEVMVEVVDDYYNNQETLRVNSIVPASPIDKSITNKPKDIKDIVSSAQAASDGEVITDDDAEKLAESAFGDDIITPDDIPDILAGKDADEEVAPESTTEDF